MFRNRQIKFLWMLPIISLLMACQQDKLVLNDCVKSVCKIESVFLNSRSFGTGFVVDNSLILTNAHVFESEEPLRYISLYFRGETSSKYAEIVKIDQLMDLALLKCDLISDLEAISFSEKNVQIGDECYNIANQSNSDLNVSKGIISNSSILIDYNGKKNESFIEASIPTYQGSSGSPLLNSDFECVGVTTFRLKDHNNKAVTSYSYSIPTSRIRTFLDNE